MSSAIIFLPKISQKTQWQVSWLADNFLCSVLPNRSNNNQWTEQFIYRLSDNNKSHLFFRRYSAYSGGDRFRISRNSLLLPHH